MNQFNNDYFIFKEHNWIKYHAVLSDFISYSYWKEAKLLRPHPYPSYYTFPIVACPN